MKIGAGSWANNHTLLGNTNIYNIQHKSLPQPGGIYIVFCLVLVILNALSVTVTKRSDRLKNALYLRRICLYLLEKGLIVCV